MFRNKNKTMLSRLKKIATTSMLITALLCWNINLVSAQGAVAITVKNPNPYTGNQSWFVYERKAGEVIEDTASLKNFGDETSTIDIYAIDASSTESGSYFLKFDNTNQTGIGQWTEVSKKTIKIEPGARVDIPFKIKIPKDLQPGQYLGGIVAEDNHQETTNGQDTDKNKASSKANIRTRMGARIYLTIPGETTEKVEFKNLQYSNGIGGKPYFTLDLVNSGNISYEPKAIIDIYDQNGKPYDHLEKQLGTLTPNTTTTPKVQWNKELAIGQYKAKVNVVFNKRFLNSNSMHASALTLNKEISFSIIPWNKILLAIFILLIPIAFCLIRKIKLEKAISSSEKYIVKEQDNLISIAKEHNLNWKYLAKINQLKAPYIIKTNTEILIPKNKNDKQ